MHSFHGGQHLPIRHGSTWRGPQETSLGRNDFLRTGSQFRGCGKVISIERTGTVQSERVVGALVGLISGKGIAGWGKHDVLELWRHP